MNLYKMHLELQCYIVDVNKSKLVYENKKIIYFERYKYYIPVLWW